MKSKTQRRTSKEVRRMNNGDIDLDAQLESLDVAILIHGGHMGEVCGEAGDTDDEVLIIFGILLRSAHDFGVSNGEVNLDTAKGEVGLDEVTNLGGGVLVLNRVAVQTQVDGAAAAELTPGHLGNALYIREGAVSDGVGSGVTGEGERIAGLTAVGSCPGALTGAYVVEVESAAVLGTAVYAGGVVEVICPEVGEPGDYVVSGVVVVAVEGNLLDDAAAEQLVALPVCLQSVIKLLGGNDLLVEAEVLDGGKAVGGGADAVEHGAHAVVGGAAPAYVHTLFEAALGHHGGGEDGPLGVEYEGSEVVHAGDIVDVELHLALHLGLQLLKALILIELLAGELAGRAVHGVDVAVDDVLQDVYEACAGAEAAAVCSHGPFLAADSGLDAAEHGVAAGVLQRHASVEHGLDDNFVVIELRHTAGTLGAGDGELPQTVGHMLVYAQGHAGLGNAQAVVGEDDHLGGQVVVAGAVRLHAADGDKAAGCDVLSAALKVKEGAAFLVSLDELVVGGLGEHDDLVAHVEQPCIKELLSLLAGESAGSDVVLNEGAKEGVDETGRVCPVGTVGDEEILIEVDDLQAFPEVSGGVLDDPVAGVSHLEQLSLASGVSGGLGLLAAALGVALAHEDHAVADLDECMVEQLAADVLVGGVSLNFSQLFLSYSAALAEADGDCALIVGAEVAGVRTVEEVLVGAHALDELGGEETLGGSGDIVLLPELVGLEDPLAVLFVYPNAAGYLPCGLEALVGVAEAALNPCVAGLLDVEVNGAAVGAGVAQEDIVIIDVNLALGKPVIKEAGALHDGILLGIGHVVIGEDAVALKVQAHVLVDALSLLLKTTNTVGDRKLKLIHVALLLL